MHEYKMVKRENVQERLDKKLNINNYELVERLNY